jgi:hypothetical protein
MIPAAEVDPGSAEPAIDVLRYFKVDVDAGLVFILPFGTILSSSRLSLYGTLCLPVSDKASRAYDPQNRHSHVEHKFYNGHSGESAAFKCRNV